MLAVVMPFMMCMNAKQYFRVSPCEQEEAEKRQTRANRFNTGSSLVSGGAQLSTITNYLGTARGNQPEAMVLSDEGTSQLRLSTSICCACLMPLN